VKIPDFISPVVAWRVWQWDTSGLKSLNGEAWLSQKPLQAGCRVHTARLSHDAPEFNCTCGIHASKSLAYLRRTQFWQYGSVHGEVSLWGSVVEHEQGFRAEFAYPKAFYLSSDILPVTLKEIEARMRCLTGYGCDISIAADGSAIPLWRKGSGFATDGLDFLMSRGQEWYARRKDECTLKAGGRIAVLGRGIAVVNRVDGEHVHAVLWNRGGLRIRRREIAWDTRNMRWEAIPHACADMPTLSS